MINMRDRLDRLDRFARLRVLAVVSVLFLSACTPSFLRRVPPTPTIPLDIPIHSQEQLRDFNFVVQAVQSQYLNNAAIGDEWQAAVNTYRNRISQGVDDAHFFDALDGLLSTLHDDDLLLSRPTAQAQLSATDTVSVTLSGVGILAALPERGKNRILVLRVYPGSPAEGAGLQAHDAIVKVDGQPVTYEDRSNVLSHVRGPSGTQVTLTVHTPGKAERDIKVTRQPLTSAAQTVAKRLPNTNIGYINPDTSNPDAMQLDVAQGLRDLSNAQTLDGLILDLRAVQSDNFPVGDLLGLFTNGQVGTAYTRNGKGKIQITGKNIAGSQELPLVVMVSDETRGEAEAFAGILQDMGRAKIVGTRTPGQAAILLPATLPNTNAVLQIPAGEIRGVKDVSWYRHGVQPDIASDQPWESYTDQDDPQLKQAEQSLTR